MEATNKFRFIGDDVKTFPNIPMGEVVETTDEWYYHIMGSVPPLAYLRGGFICGEAHSHTPSPNDPTKMIPVHLVMYQHEERVFAILLAIFSGLDYDIVLQGIKLLRHKPITE